MHYPDDLHVDFSDREVAREIHPLMGKRWSPRSFKRYVIVEEDIDTLFEAARVAPSCYNEQPWRFYLSNAKTFDDFLSLLVPENQKWAKNASLIGFISAKKTFTHNGEENAHAVFDCGAAWMSMTTQARAMGLYTHGMGGIDYDAVKSRFNVADDYTVVCGFAIGVAAEPDILPEEIAKTEKPSIRKSLSEIIAHR